MSAQILENWKQYFSEENFQTLKEFVECVESNQIFRKGEKKILCFRGAGNNGKTTLLKEIEKLVDPEKVAYSKECHFKLNPKLVIFEDYSADYDNSLLKKLTSEDKIYTAKPYQDRETYFPECNVICTTNNSGDMDELILKRMIFVDFTHVF